MGARLQPACGRQAPCVRTKPWATSLPTSFWPSGNPNQRRPSVTNLLGEYMSLKCKGGLCTIVSEGRVENGNSQ